MGDKEIKVHIRADSRYPIDRKRIRKLVRDFLREMGVEGEMQVGVVMGGDRKMKELNKKYLKVEGTTDVLSFSQTETSEKVSEFIEPTDNGLYLGEVIVSWPQAMKQALERQITVDEEVDFLVKHGLLHLMGIHHD